MSGSSPSSRGSRHFWLLAASAEAALLGGGKEWIVRVNGVDAGRTEAAITRDALHAGRDAGMTLADFDGVKGHPCGLHARGAEAVDRGGWDSVQSKLHRDAACQIAALFVAGLSAPDMRCRQVCSGRSPRVWPARP